MRERRNIGYQDTFWDGAEKTAFDSTDLLLDAAESVSRDDYSNDADYNRAVIATALSQSPASLAICNRTMIDPSRFKAAMVEALTSPEQVSMETLARQWRKVREAKRADDKLWASHQFV